MGIQNRKSQFCQAVKSDGGKCQARPVAGSSCCFFHDPGKSAEREGARRAGGLRNKLAVLASTTPDARLVDARDVAKLLTRTINQVLRGEIDPKVANAVSGLGGLLMKALHETEIESRLAALEAAVKGQPATPEFEFTLEEEPGHSAQGATNGYK